MRAIVSCVASFLILLSLPAISASQSETSPSQPEREIQPVQGGPVRRLYPVNHTLRVLHSKEGMSIQLLGTSLMPRAHGDAKISVEGDRTDIEFNLENMDRADRFGPRYLTYVGWALTTDGAQNLGEFVLDGNKSTSTFSTQAKTFALIITAEPDFAVKTHGDMVVLEADMQTNVLGDRLAANLTSRDDPGTPLILKEARIAVQLARVAGAEREAAAAFRIATQSLEQAEALFREQPGKPAAVESTARQAVIAAEDARAAADTTHDGPSPGQSR